MLSAAPFVFQRGPSEWNGKLSQPLASTPIYVSDRGQGQTRKILWLAPSGDILSQPVHDSGSKWVLFEPLTTTTAKHEGRPRGHRKAKREDRRAAAGDGWHRQRRAMDASQCLRFERETVKLFGITSNTLVQSSQRPYMGMYCGAPTAAGWGEDCRTGPTISEGNKRTTSKGTRGLRRMVSLRETLRVPTWGAKRSLTRLQGQLLFSRMDPMGKPEIFRTVALHMPTTTTFQISMMRKLYIGQLYRCGPDSIKWHVPKCRFIARIIWLQAKLANVLLAIMYHPFQDNPTNWRSLLSQALESGVCISAEHGQYAWCAIEIYIQASPGGDTRDQENCTSRIQGWNFNFVFSIMMDTSIDDLFAPIRTYQDIVAGMCRNTWSRSRKLIISTGT